jgi:hypothetical protein
VRAQAGIEQPDRRGRGTDTHQIGRISRTDPPCDQREQQNRHQQEQERRFDRQCEIGGDSKRKAHRKPEEQPVAFLIQTRR